MIQTTNSTGNLLVNKNLIFKPIIPKGKGGFSTGLSFEVGTLINKQPATLSVFWEALETKHIDRFANSFTEKKFIEKFIDIILNEKEEDPKTKKFIELFHSSPKSFLRKYFSFSFFRAEIDYNNLKGIPTISVKTKFSKYEEMSCIIDCTGDTFHFLFSTNFLSKDFQVDYEKGLHHFYQSFKDCREKLSYSEGIHYFFHTINVHKDLLLKKGFLSTLSEMNRSITKSSFKDFDKRRYICLQC